MSFIEGIGDEVTAFAVLILIFILAASVTFLLNVPFSESHQNSAVNIPNTSTEQLASEDPILDDISDTSSDENIESVNENVSDSASNCNVDHSESLNQETDETESVHIVTKGEASVKNESGNSIDLEDAENQPNSNSCDIPFVPIEENTPIVESQIPEPGCINIRLKYLNDTERIVSSHPLTRIGDFKRSHFAEDIANNKTVHLIYSGQRLQDNETLRRYGIITHNCVLHVQISPAQTQTSTTSSQSTELDISNWFWTLLSLMLLLVWVVYFKHPELFNVMSFSILIVFSGGIVFCYTQAQRQEVV